MILKSKTLIKILSFNFARAMALFPIILIRDEDLRYDKCLVNHEKIHLRQQLELLIVFFYVWYGLEYLYRRLKFKNHREAYYNISFEKEAYANEHDLEYLKNRKMYSFFKYM